MIVHTCVFACARYMDIQYIPEHYCHIAIGHWERPKGLPFLRHAMSFAAAFVAIKCTKVGAPGAHTSPEASCTRMYWGSTRHLRTLKASHLRTLQTSHLRTEKPRHPRTKSGHPRTLRLGASHFGFGWGGGVGWGGMITFMFLCTHRHSNLIIFLPVEQRQAQLFHDQLPVGWGELIRFMFLCIQTHSNLSFLL